MNRFYQKRAGLIGVAFGAVIALVSIMIWPAIPTVTASGNVVCAPSSECSASGASTTPLSCDGTNCTMSGFGFLGWSDTKLYRDAANTLAQRNGTNAQTFNWYYSYTDASNYQRGALKTSATGIEIAAETAGTGADNLDVTLTPAGTGVTKVTRLTSTGDIVGTGGLTVANAITWSGAGSGYISPGTTAGTVGSFRIVGGSGVTGLNMGGDTASYPTLLRDGVGVVVEAADASTGAFIGLVEQTAPAAPAANGARLYAKDNGAGKTQLCVIFATGAEQCFAVEP